MGDEIHVPYEVLSARFFYFYETKIHLIEDNRGELWYHHHLRPFMRCLNNYAQCLYTVGSHDKALATYKEILELSKRDNMGVCYIYGHIY